MSPTHCPRHGQSTFTVLTKANKWQSLTMCKVKGCNFQETKPAIFERPQNLVLAEVLWAIGVAK